MSVPGVASVAADSPSFHKLTVSCPLLAPHLAGFLVLYLYLSFQDLSSIVRGLSIFLAIVVTADVIRLNNAAFEKFYESVLGFLMREAEKVRRPHGRGSVTA